MEMNRRAAITAAVALAVAPQAAARTRVKPRQRANGVYAERGEKTYCAFGCHIGEFGNTVYVGALPNEGDLITVPKMHIGATECPFCKSQVVAGYGLYYFAA